MRKSSIKRVFAIFCCVLIFGSMGLLLAACGGSTAPASPGGGQNQAPGYSIIGVFNHELQIWWPQR